MQHYTVATIPVIDTLPSELLSLFTAVESWYRQVSHDICRIRIDLRPCTAIEQNQNSYSQAGGMGSPPGNSQALVRHVLDCSNHDLVQRLRAGGERLMIITGNAFKPHTWRLPNRGIHYTIIPSNASFGAIAHELGHLLFDWPDLDWEKSLGRDCLMSMGAVGNHGRNPSPPCAPLRMNQGWMDPLVIDGATTVKELNTHRIGIVNWRQQSVLVEFRQRYEQAFLLVYTCKGNDKSLRPRIIGRIKLTEADCDTAVLGSVATALRSC